MSKVELPRFSIKQLLEAGVHFGHKTMRRNPQMSKYIYTSRNNVSIIDLNKTAVCLQSSLRLVKEVAKNNGRILFVATKKQAADVVAAEAKRCGQYYVNFRWLGGMLTNWKTVSQSIKTFRKVEEKLDNDEIGYNKKEKLVLERQRLKFEQALGGIKDMGGYPDLVFVIDTNKESIAIAEAKKLKVPIMAILDTNCKTKGITYPIPGNDDSTKSIKLFCRLISDAAIAGTKENMALSGIDITKFDGDIEKLKASKKPEENKPKKAKKEEVKVEIKKEIKKPKKEIVKKSEAVKAPEEKTASSKAEKKPAAKKPAAKKAVAKKPAAKKETSKAEEK